MQGYKTWKFMLPCRRRVHSHKSTNFKTIFEQIQKNHKNDAKNDPKTSEKNIQKLSNKWFGKSIENIFQTIRCWLPFGSLLPDGFWLLRVIFATYNFRTSGGTPLVWFWPPLGHPWFDFVDLLHDSRSNFAPNFEDSRATNYTNHTFKQNKQGLIKTKYR